MKRFLLFVLVAVQVSAASGQAYLKDSILKKATEKDNKDTVAWIYGGQANLGINQGFIHNWAAGGEIASLNVSGLASMYLTRLYHRHTWNNNLYASYGLFYAYSNRFVPRKTDDRIDFTSKYGIRLDTAKDFYLTTLANFVTQFTKGYDYELPRWDTTSTSKFMSPAYLTLGLGMEYRKGSNFTLFLSPIAARMTFADRFYTTMNPVGAFGIDYGETSRLELGAYFAGTYKVDINPNTFYRARVTLYSNYLAKDKTDTLGNVIKKDSPGNIDVFVDNVFSMKVSKYFTLLFNLTVLYDNDIPYDPTFVNEAGVVQDKDDPGKGLGWAQVRQTMTIGLSYKF